jgi:hypothetical protein
MEAARAGAAEHRVQLGAPVPPSPTSTSLKCGTPSGTVWPGKACNNEVLMDELRSDTDCAAEKPGRTWSKIHI